MSVDPSEAEVVHCANCGGPIKSLAADSLCPYCGAHVHQVTAEEKSLEAVEAFSKMVSDVLEHGGAVRGKTSPQAAPIVNALSAFNSAKDTFAEVKKGFRIVKIVFFLLILAFFAIVFLSHLK